MRSITIIAHDRPALFAELLRSLIANDLRGWQIVVRVEPGPKADAFADLTRDLLGGATVDFAVNPTILGIQQNSFQTMRHAFELGSKLNIYLEEDFLVAPDLTEMALWYERNHQPHWLCLSMLAGPCGSAAMLSDLDFADTLVESRCFNSIGFALRREEWELHVQKVWLNADTGKLGLAAWRSGWSWDWSIYALVANHPTLRTVQPILARSNHNGRLGTFSRAKFHDSAFVGLALSRAPAKYRLVDPQALPHPVRSHLNAHAEITDMRLMLEDESIMTQASLASYARKRARRWWKRKILRQRPIPIPNDSL